VYSTSVVCVCADMVDCVLVGEADVAMKKHAIIATKHVIVRWILFTPTLCVRSRQYACVCLLSRAISLPTHIHTQNATSTQALRVHRSTTLCAMTVCVGAGVGVCVGAKVGVCVGVCVGREVGLCVGVEVGDCVGVCVGTLDGVRVGLADGIFVGECVCDCDSVGCCVGDVVVGTSCVWMSESVCVCACVLIMMDSRLDTNMRLTCCCVCTNIRRLLLLSVPVCISPCVSVCAFV
jgi:hypothetical protein